MEPRMKIPCPHWQDSVCGLASALAGSAVHPHPSACDHCSSVATPPQALNSVTVSLAGSQLTGSAFAKFLATHGHWINGWDASCQRLQAVLDGQGPGSELWRLLVSLGIRHKPSCDCLGLAERMNAWGPVGCRLARQEIVEQLRRNSQAYGWGDVAGAAIKAVATGLAWRLSPIDPYGSLLDESIRRAVIAEKSRCANPADAKGDAAQCPLF